MVVGPSSRTDRGGASASGGRRRLASVRPLDRDRRRRHAANDSRPSTHSSLIIVIPNYLLVAQCTRTFVRNDPDLFYLPGFDAEFSVLAFSVATSVEIARIDAVRACDARARKTLCRAPSERSRPGNNGGGRYARETGRVIDQRKAISPAAAAAAAAVSRRQRKGEKRDGRLLVHGWMLLSPVTSTH